MMKDGLNGLVPDSIFQVSNSGFELARVWIERPSMFLVRYSLFGVQFPCSLFFRISSQNFLNSGTFIHPLPNHRPCKTEETG
jgi:hypothetical protein